MLYQEYGPVPGIPDLVEDFQYGRDFFLAHTRCGFI